MPTVRGNYSIEFEHCLGGGTYGQVYPAKKVGADNGAASSSRGAGASGTTTAKVNQKVDDKQKYVVKVPTRKNDSSIATELQQLQNLKHANIIAVVDFFEHHGKIHLVLPRAKSDMWAAMEAGRLTTEYEKWICAAHLISALDYIRENNVLHRDIKPGNVLYFPVTVDPRTKRCTPASWKLADLGLSKFVANPALSQPHTSRVGTHIYSSPAVLRGDPYSSRADCWSMGVVLWELIMGRGLFNLVSEVLEFDPATAKSLENLPGSVGSACRCLLGRPDDDAHHLEPSSGALWELSQPVDEVEAQSVQLRFVGGSDIAGFERDVNTNSLILECWASASAHLASIGGGDATMGFAARARILEHTASPTFSLYGCCWRDESGDPSELLTRLLFTFCCKHHQVHAARRLFTNVIHIWRKKHGAARSRSRFVCERQHLLDIFAASFGSDEAVSLVDDLSVERGACGPYRWKIIAVDRIRFWCVTDGGSDDDSDTGNDSEDEESQHAEEGEISDAEEEGMDEGGQEKGQKITTQKLPANRKQNHQGAKAARERKQGNVKKQNQNLKHKVKKPQ